ncbi:DUF4214 domain-containing protein [Candidatus Sumerlaeota bacterium]|nr:DUF4214 domain-containing protein [Candidatus Sumerlaeota bacterium]
MQELRNILVLVLISVVFVSRGEVSEFNTMVGTQTFAPHYQFTSETMLIECAREIYNLGSDVIKFEFSPRYPELYSLPLNSEIKSLRDLATKEPSYRQLLEMPFKYFIMWVYPFKVPIFSWRDGYPEEERQTEYQETYEFASYLLSHFNGSGKSFLFGHWEGDWVLLYSYDAESTPTQERIEAMKQWYQVRQRAIEDACRDVPHHNVYIYQYAEVNLVKKAMQSRPTVLSSVLPYVQVDLVSYSAWDMIGDPETFGRFDEVMDFIQNTANFTERFPSVKKVFIGEYGSNVSEESQATLPRDMIKKSVPWGSPFLLYWQIYSGTPSSTMDFWLITPTGRKVQAYYVMQRFLGKINGLKNYCKVFLKRNPEKTEISGFAKSFEQYSLFSFFESLLDSKEYKRKVSDKEFLGVVNEDIMLRSLSEAELNIFAERLANGEKRSTILREVINSMKFHQVVSETRWRKYLWTKVWLKKGKEALPQLPGVSRYEVWRSIIDSIEFCDAELKARELPPSDIKNMHWLNFREQENRVGSFWSIY